ARTYLNKRPSLKEDSIGVKGRFVFLDSVYLFEPVPASLNKNEEKYIWGAQGNMWTEFIKEPSMVEYLLFPRLSALSEVLWSPPEAKNWSRFQASLPLLYKRYRLWGVNYETHYYTDRNLDPADYGLNSD